MKQVETLNRDENEKRYRILHYKVQSERLARTWKRFAAAGFEPLLIKGWWAAQLYPQPSERQYTDVDLVISPKDFQRAKVFVRENSLESVVDLHCGARHLDSLPFADLYANSVTRDCEGVSIRVPREEDHLRILCVHWLNDGGADRERLRDVYYGIENRSDAFEWERFLETVGRRRRRWLICAVGLASLYLGLDIKNTPLAKEAAELPEWLIRAVEAEWESGVRLVPLRQVLHDKKRLWEQIRKRTPPNPIQATIEMNGDFDRVPRFVYQLANLFWRLPASVQQIAADNLGRRAAHKLKRL